ncbi:MAG: MIP/aquaporin family protein [Thermoanaerobaculia bacterium]
MHRYLTETIGTFFLVLTIGLTAVSGFALAPLAIGSILMVMVYMGGHVSGAHYNPAVSFAVFMRGKLSGGDMGAYFLAQIVGALLAALAVYFMTGGTFAPAPGAGAALLSVLLAEFLFTFALALVVLQVATSPKTDGNSFYGLAIGFTVAAGAMAVGDISGAAFNPAVGIGPTIIDTALGGGSPTSLWIYIVAPLLGGAVAASVYRIQSP